MQIIFKPIDRNNLNEATTIYNFYVKNSTATFHLEEVTDNEMLEMLYINHPIYKSFVVLQNNQVVGFCYISPYRKKEAYNISAEITLYIKQEFTGKQIGKQILDYLARISKEKGIKNLIGVITLENTGSVKLFERCGYFKCGHLKNIGVKFGKTLDVVSYQKEI